MSWLLVGLVVYSRSDSLASEWQVRESNPRPEAYEALAARPCREAPGRRWVSAVFLR